MSVALVLSGWGPSSARATSAGASALRAEPSTEAPLETQLSFDDLMTRGERQYLSGEYVASARSYAAAHRSLAETERIQTMGTMALERALKVYEAAQGAQPERMVLIEEPIALLEEYMAERARGIAAGEAEAVPEALVEELERLRVLHEQAQARARAAEVPPPPQPASDASASGTSPASPSSEPTLTASPAEATVSAPPEPRVLPRPPSEPAPAPEPPGLVLVPSLGLVALIGGGALIGVGGWILGEIDRRTTRRQQVFEWTEPTDLEREEFIAGLSEWRDQQRAIAAGLIVPGVITMAAGAGLTIWGAIRMRRQDRPNARPNERPRARARLSIPVPSRSRVGLTLSMDF